MDQRSPKRHCGDRRRGGFTTSAADLRALVEPVVAVFGLGGSLGLELSDARLRASRGADTSTHAIEVSLVPPNAAFARGSHQESCAGRVPARALTACLLELSDDCRVSLEHLPEEGRLRVSNEIDRSLARASSRLTFQLESAECSVVESWQRLLCTAAPIHLSLRSLVSFTRRADDLSTPACSFTQEASEDERHAAFLVLACDTAEGRASNCELELRSPISFEAVSESEVHRVEHVPVCALADVCRAIETVAHMDEMVSLAMTSWGVLLRYASCARGLELRASVLRYPSRE